MTKKNLVKEKLVLARSWLKQLQTRFLPWVGLSLVHPQWLPLVEPAHICASEKMKVDEDEDIGNVTNGFDTGDLTLKQQQLALVHIDLDQDHQLDQRLKEQWF